MPIETQTLQQMLDSRGMTIDALLAQVVNMDMEKTLNLDLLFF